MPVSKRCNCTKFDLEDFGWPNVLHASSCPQHISPSSVNKTEGKPGPEGRAQITALPGGGGLD